MFFEQVPPCIAFQDTVYSFNDVSGASMQPTLNPAGEPFHDLVLVERWPVRRLYWYRRGDVVLLKCGRLALCQKLCGACCWYRRGGRR